jgi:predicted DNA-binding protein (MmcQ/YjbR family)
MDEEQVVEYLLKQPKATLDFPFGEDVQVFKVVGKMFATLALAKDVKKTESNQALWWLNLKCDPTEAVMLREIFPAIIPGYHMNKKLWNTVILDGSVPAGELARMIDNSYHLVVSKLPKKQQQAILLHQPVSP